MLNKIWFGLLCIGLVYGFCKAAYQSVQTPRERSRNQAATSEGEKGGAKPQAAEAKSAEKDQSEEPELGLTAMGKRLNLALLEGAQSAVTICIGLIGITALWLGMMSIAKDAGLIDAFARVARPLMRWLFPEVPDGHPAQGAMLMNISANMLGMDNAATPMGLKAMEELQTLNPHKDTATNSMVMFLAINNSSVTIIPFTLIGYRAIAGSANPAEPLAGILIVTTFSTVFAVLMTKWLSRRRAYESAPAAAPSHSDAPGSNDRGGHGA
jgi:spore maturation protein SpmA